MLLSEGANPLADLQAEVDSCPNVTNSNAFGKTLGTTPRRPWQNYRNRRGPGGAEKKEARAFAGPSGKQLQRWLVQCSASPHNPHRGIYFTSTIKSVKKANVTWQR